MALFSVDLQQYNKEDEMVSILEWIGKEGK